MDAKLLAAVKAAFPATDELVTLGAPVHLEACEPTPTIGIPVSMMNRHGLIAGATGTGKTKTLQLLAEQLSNAGVPVFLADVKGDVSGIATAGEATERVQQRATETGYAWRATACPVEFLSLTGAKGAQVRATVTTFGPLLLAKVLGLNDTQTSVLTMVFKYCDDRDLDLIDFGDLRAVLDYLSNEGADDLKNYGGMSKQTVGVLLRELIGLEQQGALQFFGEPDFELGDLLQVERDGRGLVSVLELSDCQDKPALFSTFMMWMLARLYADLPEVGDAEKPKLIFFFDEAHLLFNGASKAFLDQVQQVVRLIRSKGVGIFFITQNPKDVPADVLGQLGHRVQHALRAFTPDDEKALKAAARTYPKTEFYDVEKTLTSLGIGEAFVTVLSPKGVPTPPFATRIVPPATRMGPLTDAEMLQRLSASRQVKKYAAAVNPESAEEKIAAMRRGDAPAAAAGNDDEPVRPSKAAPGMLASILNSSVTKQVARTVANTLTRSILGALVGTPQRRRRSSRYF